MELDNEFRALLESMNKNIKDELTGNINNFKKKLVSKLYRNLDCSLPERFLIQVQNIRSSSQTIIFPNTNFSIKNKYNERINVLSMETNDLLPYKKINTKIDKKRLIIDILMFDSCHLSRDYISLWLNPYIKNEISYYLYNKFLKKDVTIKMVFEDDLILLQKSSLQPDQYNNLPINSSILDRLFSQIMYSKFRLPISRLKIDNKYIKKIIIEIEHEDNDIAQLVNINNLWFLNLIPLYNLQRDYSSKSIIDSHHNKFTIKPEILDNKYKLIYLLKIYLENKSISLDDYDLYLDLDEQIIQNYSNFLSKKNMYVDGLWHKQINNDEYTEVELNDMSADLSIVKSFSALLRHYQDHLSILPSLNKIGFENNANNIKIILCLLLTGQTNTNSNLFTSYTDRFFFKKNNIECKHNNDIYHQLFLQNIFDSFLLANRPLPPDTI